MNNFCLANIHISGFKNTLIYDGEFPLTVSGFKSWVLRKQFPQFQNSLVDEFYVLSQTCIKHDDDFISGGQTYHLLPRLIGGKGGFGSMLRAIGAQIEKTTNREACRDLSGRRMRDINNEKQLKDWMAKQKDREKERARRREEKAARRRAEPLHKFEDKLYDQQKEKVSQDLDAALQQGLKRAQAASTASSNGTVTSAKKRKVDASLQKQWDWIGVMEDDSTNSEMSDDDVTGGARACPGFPTSQTTESGASTSAAPDQELQTANSDSQSSLESLPSATTTSSQSVASSEPISGHTIEENVQDLTAVFEKANCAEDLECLGLEKLKSALMDRGLKCGGTLTERAQRLFAVRGLSSDQIDPAFFAKPTKGKGAKKNK